ncbi:hypothetical protein CBS101457_002915 [Exobasidium rhododendri]|nr:hypothetical protein CBS101457_002915 [Exobasidium rhododendri]
MAAPSTRYQDTHGEEGRILRRGTGSSCMKKKAKPINVGEVIRQSVILNPALPTADQSSKRYPAAGATSSTRKTASSSGNLTQAKTSEQNARQRNASTY